MRSWVWRRPWRARSASL